MSIDFEFYETPDPSGEKKERYHARVVSRNTVTTDKMADIIQEASSLTITDVKAVLTALSYWMAEYMADGNRVHLEGIGYFQPTLKCTQEVDPRKTKAQSVWFKSVKFRADQQLKKRLKNVHTKRSSMKIHSAKLANDQVDKKIADYISVNNFITRKQIQELLRMTDSTMHRHIQRMIKEGKIKNTGTRTHHIYIKG